MPLVDGARGAGVQRHPRRSRRAASGSGTSSPGASRSCCKAIQDARAAPLQSRLAQAARRRALQPSGRRSAGPGPAGAAARQDRSVDRPGGARAAQRRSRRSRSPLPALIVEYRQLTKLVEHLPHRAGRGDQPGDGPRARVVQPDRRRDRAAEQLRPEPPEHPDPHRRRPRDPPRVQGRAGERAAHRRLLADRAASARAPLGRSRAHRGLPPAAPTSTPRSRRRSSASTRSDVTAAPAQLGQDGELRHRLRHHAVRPGPPARGPASPSSRRRRSSTTTRPASRRIDQFLGECVRMAADRRATSRRSSAAGARFRRSRPATRSSGRSASAWRSTRSCRARPRTSSSSR